MNAIAVFRYSGMIIQISVHSAYATISLMQPQKPFLGNTKNTAGRSKIPWVVVLIIALISSSILGPLGWAIALVAGMRLIFLWQDKASVGGAPLDSAARSKKVLDSMLLLIVACALMVGAAFLLTYAVCAGQGAGCGDIFLIALVPIFLGGSAMIVYLPMAGFYFFRSLRRKETVALRHVLGVCIVLGLGLLPNVGPLWLMGAMINQNYIQPYVHDLEYQRNGGPSAEMKAKVTLGTYEEAVALIRSCNVSSIEYFTYDYRGPYDAVNTYILVRTRNNGSVAYERAPDNVKLPFSDKERIEAAAREKNADLSGSYPNCKNEIKIDPRGHFR